MRTYYASPHHTLASQLMHHFEVHTDSKHGVKDADAQQAQRVAPELCATQDAFNPAWEA